MVCNHSELQVLSFKLWSVTWSLSWFYSFTEWQNSFPMQRVIGQEIDTLNRHSCLGNSQMVFANKIVIILFQINNYLFLWTHSPICPLVSSSSSFLSSSSFSPPFLEQGHPRYPRPPWTIIFLPLSSRRQGVHHYIWHISRVRYQVGLKKYRLIYKKHFLLKFCSLLSPMY